MYYPYLRGRQYELIALRDFSEKINPEETKVFPIIEPVRKNMNALKKAISTMSEHDIKCGIILNPQKGECKGDIIDFSTDETFPPMKNTWAPIFIVEQNNATTIQEEIHRHAYANVILIIEKGTAIDEEALSPLIKNKSIDKIITDPSRRHIARDTKKAHKDLIELDDKFGAQPSNQAYSDINEELFTEEFYYYKEDGFQGFSDYTVIPNELREGGTLPKVVVIHLTYRKNKEQIFVKHFCSDSNSNDQSNIQGKFAEAAQKAISFFKGKSYETVAIQQLEDYILQKRFPGLGMIKKISILHHLELIQKSLSEI